MEAITLTNYWRCILILLRNFHAVNKTIFACKINTVKKIKNGLRNVDVENITINDIEKQNFNNYLLLPATEDDLLLMENYEQSNVDVDGFIICFELLTRKQGGNKKVYGLIDFDRHMYCCKFAGGDIYDDFSVKFFENQLQIKLLTSINSEHSSRWCEFVLKPKLLNWCRNSNRLNKRQNILSLQLIDAAEYNELYKMLKQKYSKQTLQFWKEAKESTDPLKFIYEDLAIAAYLICLWRSTETLNIVFADLGCGNGLLVYVLSQEGFHGYGFDIRARKLWSHYPKDTYLIEKAIDPDTFVLPKEVNWLIGNHSDELSPWLPVIAAAASYEMCYFLLPCCAYEFTGVKFQRRDSRLSGYADFLDYMFQISDNCGFITQKDRLKIPSTKRIALIGMNRFHPIAQYDVQKKEIWSFVGSERALHAHGVANGIKLRQKIDNVRNCTQKDKNVIHNLALKIFTLLLQHDNSSVNEANSSKSWYLGTRLSMRTITQHLSKQDLAEIKNECGGIKTLLRNKHEIFEFFGNDLIGIRKPIVRIINKPQTVKKRICFFQTYHPSGCPLSDNECTFIHTSKE